MDTYVHPAIGKKDGPYEEENTVFIMLSERQIHE